jgi:hypothetical protein
MDEYLGGLVIVAEDARKADRTSLPCPAGTSVMYVGEVELDSSDINDILSWMASAEISTSVPCSAISLGREERLE